MTKYGPSALAKYGNEHEEMQDIARANLENWYSFHCMRDFILAQHGITVYPACIDELNAQIFSNFTPESRKRKLRKVRAYIKRQLAKG